MAKSRECPKCSTKLAVRIFSADDPMVKCACCAKVFCLKCSVHKVWSNDQCPYCHTGFDDSNFI